MISNNLHRMAEHFPEEAKKCAEAICALKESFENIEGHYYTFEDGSILTSFGKPTIGEFVIDADEDLREKFADTLCVRKEKHHGRDAWIFKDNSAVVL